VWAQQLMHGMHHAELPVCCDCERLNHCVRVQPANTYRHTRLVFRYLHKKNHHKHLAVLVATEQTKEELCTSG
jgi:hypothetical protein